MLHALLAAFCSVALLGGAILAPASSVHPADGPDLDLRWIVDGRLVRLELVLNLAFLDEIAEIAREDEDALHPLEAAEVRAQLEPLLAARHALKIDGVAVPPRWLEFSVAEPERNLLPLFPRYGLRALTKVRFVAEYPTSSDPREVALSWDLYPPDRVREDDFGQAPPMEVNARLLADGVEKPIVFKQEQPEISWQASEAARAARFLPVPVLDLGSRGWRWPRLSYVALLCGVVWMIASVMRRRRPRAALALKIASLVLLLVGGLGPRVLGESEPRAVRDAELAAVFEPLHANIYRAFGFTQESAIYDALAQSLAGRELLERIYGEIYAGLVLAEEGGAVSTVQEVRHTRTEIVERSLEAVPPRFALRARWEVDGIVRHFGHAHWRTNAYEARYELARTAAGWRIVASEILSSERLASGTNDPSRADAEPLPDRSRR
ncbi:MAG: hypothetical protein JNM84_28645 [Planctomycetes bacterium]|nr:hypothetical protein [Planctomycetota bacterium]